MGPLDPACCRRQDDSTAGRQLPASGDEIGMEMRLSGVADDQPPTLCRSEMPRRVTGWIEHESVTIAEVHQVRRVTQALVDEHHHRLCRPSHDVSNRPFQADLCQVII